MSNTKPTTFGELAQVIDELPVVLRGLRRSRGLSQREAAKQMGISFATVGRVEQGTECDTGTLLAILRWLDAPLAASPLSEEKGEGRG